MVKPRVPADAVPLGKIPVSDVKDAPKQGWSQSIIGAINEILSVGGPKNIELRTVQISVPDPWQRFDTVWTADIGDPFGKPGDGLLGYYKIAKLYDGSAEIYGYWTDSGGAAPGTVVARLPEQLIPALDSTASEFMISVGMNITPASVKVPCFAGVSYNGDMYIGQPGQTGSWWFHHRWMCRDNKPEPLNCFPIQIKVSSKLPPKAVFAVGNERYDKDNKAPLAPAGFVDWRFIHTANGPVVEIKNITGLEYGTRQKVTLAVIGD